MWTTFFPPYIKIWGDLRFSAYGHPELKMIAKSEKEASECWYLREERSMPKEVTMRM